MTSGRLISKLHVSELGTKTYARHRDKESVLALKVANSSEKIKKTIVNSAVLNRGEQRAFLHFLWKIFLEQVLLGHKEETQISRFFEEYQCCFPNNRDYSTFLSKVNEFTFLLHLYQYWYLSHDDSIK